jgi:hypothetical protein
VQRCKRKFLPSWNNLYEILDKCREKGTKMLFDRDYKSKEQAGLITIKELTRIESGCGRCQNNYEAYELSGELSAKWHETAWQWLPYTASISQYEMHRCTNDTPDYNPEFNILFKPYVDGTRYCVPSTYWHPDLIGFTIDDPIIAEYRKSFDSPTSTDDEDSTTSSEESEVT